MYFWKPYSVFYGANVLILLQLNFLRVSCQQTEESLASPASHGEQQPGSVGPASPQGSNNYHHPNLEPAPPYSPTWEGHAIPSSLDPTGESAEGDITLYDRDVLQNRYLYDGKTFYIRAAVLQYPRLTSVYYMEYVTDKTTHLVFHSKVAKECPVRLVFFHGAYQLRFLTGLGEFLRAHGPSNRAVEISNDRRNQYLFKVQSMQLFSRYDRVLMLCKLNKKKVMFTLDFVWKIPKPLVCINVAFTLHEANDIAAKMFISSAETLAGEPVPPLPPALIPQKTHQCDLYEKQLKQTLRTNQASGVNEARGSRHSDESPVSQWLHRVMLRDTSL